MDEIKVQHRYRVKTEATVYVGDSYYKIPVEFLVREMPWDKGKTVDKIVKEEMNRAYIEFSLKKKKLSVVKEF